MKESMKLRTFIILIITILFLLVGFYLWRSSPSKTYTNEELLNRPIGIPLAAKFFPKNSLLTIHWIVNPKKIPHYLETIIPGSSKTDAKNKAEIFINDLFGIIDLDFEKDLSEWVGEEISFTLLPSERIDTNFDWIMAISLEENSNKEIFLEQFWNKHSRTGNDLEINHSQHFSLITGPIDAISAESRKISTVQIENELILFSSNKNILEKAIKMSTSTNENQLNDSLLNESFQNLGDGIAFISASNQGIHNLLDFKNQMIGIDQINSLVSRLQLKGKDIIIETTIYLNKNLNKELANTSINSLLPYANGPANLIEIVNATPEFVSPIEQKVIMESEQTDTALPNLKEIAISNKLPVLHILDQEDWILATPENTYIEEIADKNLTKNGYKKNEINYNSQTLEVWAKLIVEKISNRETINNDIGLILLKENNINWWSNKLDLIERKSKNNQPDESGMTLNIYKDEQERKIYQQIIFSGNYMKSQLNSWRPWLLVNTLSGNSLGDNAKILIISIESPEKENENSLSIHSRLSFG